MRRLSIFVGAVVALTVALAMAATREPGPRARKAARPSNAPAVAAGPLEAVADRSTVCMVNDRDMRQPQIPVVVEGRTYYGCCPMCKDRLQQSTAARTAVDPVSGRTVDKARAVIARHADGRVVYFETRDNLERYHRTRP